MSLKVKHLCLSVLFFGANLTALIKSNGGIRPIVVDCALRRLVAKVASNRVRDDMVLLFAPRQLGYGIKRGAEAAVHAARLFLHTLVADHVVMILDFKNAFNSVRRDKMLTAVRNLVPMLFTFIHSVYSFPSLLFWVDKIIQSSEGVQQGDPLGSLLFCLCIGYIDDLTVGGTLEDVQHDVARIEHEAA